MKKSLKQGSTLAVETPSPSLRGKLLFAASAGILALVAPGGIYGTRAHAQVSPVPDECNDAVDPNDANNSNNGDDFIDSGETIVCVQNLADLGPIDPIVTDVDELTLIIGDGMTEETQVLNDLDIDPVIPVNENTVINMSGASNQTLNIKSDGSVLQEFGDVMGATPAVVVSSSGGNVAIEHRGQIESRGTQTGQAINAQVTAGEGNLTIDSEGGSILGSVYAKNEGTGQIDLTLGATTQNFGTASTVEISTGSGTGNVALTTKGAIQTNGADAVEIDNSGVGDTTVTVENDIDAAGIGVRVNHSADGNLRITTASGTTVTGGTNDGIRATNTGTGTSYIKTEGAVSGGGSNGEGITLSHDSNANATVKTYADVTSLEDHAVRVRNGRATAVGATTGNTLVETNAALSGTIGVNVAHHSSRNLTINTKGAITSTGDGLNDAGIRVANAVESWSISITTDGIIEAEQRRGIDVQNSNTASLIITTYADITAASQVASANTYEGIRVQNSGRGTSLYVNAGVTGGRGIGVEAAGSAGIFLGSNAAITGVYDDGVYLKATGEGGTVTVGGQLGGGATVIGARDGLDLRATNGSIRISKLKTVQGGSGAGIRAYSTGGDIDISDITEVFSESNWAIYVDTSDSDDNIGYVGGGANVSIQNVAIPKLVDTSGSTSTVLESADGISVYSGTGSINIGAEEGNSNNAIGDIYTQRVGIYAGTNGGAVSIRTQGTIDTIRESIEVKQLGKGNVAITTNGAIISTNDDGLYVDTAGGDVTIVNTSTIEAKYDGIDVDHDTGGTIRVTANGDINAGDRGIEIESGLTTPEESLIFVNVNEQVSGDNYGAFIKHDGTGRVELTLGANGELEGENQDGALIETQVDGASILVQGSSSKISGGDKGLNLTTTTGTITVQGLALVEGEDEQGIYASTLGGAVTIRDIGSVTSEDGWAIDADTRIFEEQGGDDVLIAGADITIQNVAIPKVSDFVDPETDDVYSTKGIRAQSGTGNINIGAVNGEAANQIGDIFTEYTAIFAYSDGGVINVVTDGTITSSDGDGINIYNYGSGDTTVTSNKAITAFDDGIDILNEDGGITRVTVNGAINAGDRGLEIDIGEESPDAASTYINVNAKVVGEDDGLDLDHEGLGQVVLTLGSNGELIGEDSRGARIDVNTDNTSALVQGSSGVISGGEQGLYVSTQLGAITITDLSSVSGGEYEGIRARSEGGGITISNIGNATSLSEEGIEADSRLKEALLDGEGVELRDEDGNELFVYSGGADISIQNVEILEFDGDDDTTNALNRSAEGINAYSGTGSINIGALDGDAANAVGDIITSGTGINAISEGGAVQIRVDGDIEAGGAAIAVENKGTSVVTEITLGGTVTSGTTGSVPGVALSTAAGATVTVTEDGSVTSSNGIAIGFKGYDDAITDDTLTLAGSVLSDVLMGTGADTFNFSGTIGDGSTVFGGDGTDTVSITSTLARTLTGSGDTGDSIQEFEIFNFDGDNVTLAGDHIGWQQANFRAGTTAIAENASLSAVTGTIFAGATLNARDGSTFTGNLINNGILEIGSSPGTFTLNGNFTQGATGVLPIEFDGDEYDQFIITGTAELGGTLRLTVLNPLNPANLSGFSVLQAAGGIINDSEFDNVIDEIPDLDIALDYSSNNVLASFEAVQDAGTGGEGEGSGTGGEGEGSGTGGEGDGSGEDPTDPVAPEPDPEPAAPLLSPKEIAPSALMAGMFASDLFADSLIQRRSETMSPGEWSFWTTGLGGRYDVGNSANQTGWEGGNSGFAFGAQHLIEQNGVPILFGISTGFTEADLDSGFSHAKVDSAHLGGFVNAQIDGLFLAAAASHAWQDYSLQRVFLFGDGKAAIARSETEGKASSFKTELHYDLFWSAEKENGVSFGPVLTAGLTTATTNRFKESGAGLLNLTYEDETAQQVTVGAGAEGRYETVLFGHTRIDAGAHVLWENLSGDTQITSRASLIVPGADFTPSSSRLDNTRAALGADAKIYFSDKIYGHIRYDTTRSENFTDHEGWAGITFRF